MNVEYNVDVNEIDGGLIYMLLNVLEHFVDRLLMIWKTDERNVLCWSKTHSPTDEIVKTKFEKFIEYS